MLKISNTIVIVLLLISFSISPTSVEARNQTKLQVKKKLGTTRYLASASTAKKMPAVFAGKSRKAKFAKSKKLIKRASVKRVSVAPRAIYIPEKLSFGDLEGLQKTYDPLYLKSSVALIIDQESSQVLFEKNAHISLPIASITKLMTSLVVLEAAQDMNELLEITSDDIDKEKNSGSRLRVGSQLTRADMLHIALMSSENRAASSLGRNYPGGLKACVDAMNAKAKALGMSETFYSDTTGLSSRNVASAQDLAKLVKAAYKQPVIRQYSTDTRYAVSPNGRPLEYISSNRLTSNSDWQIGLQKTGYISEAGRCLVMQAMIKGRAIVMVFLDSKGKYSRFADAGRIRNWLESNQQVAKSTF